MPINPRQIAAKTAVALIVAPMGAYLGLLAWMLATQLLFALSGPVGRIRRSAP